MKALTPAQEAKIPQYLKKSLAYTLCTDPCDRPKAEAAVAATYAFLKKPAPKFVWELSPKAGARIAAGLQHGVQNPTPEQIKEVASLASFGSFESYWVSFYDFLIAECGAPAEPLVPLLVNVVKECGVYWAFEDVCVMTDRPSVISIDMDNKLHSEEGMALEYRDGHGINVLRGEKQKSRMSAVLKSMTKENGK